MFTSSTKHDITGCLRDTGVTFGTSFVPEWNSCENRLERFHSRGQHLCKFITTNEIIYIRKEFNSHRIALVHQHGRRSSFWKTNMAAVTLACVAGAWKEPAQERTGARELAPPVLSCAHYFQAAGYRDVMWKRSIILRRSLSRQIRYACATGPRLLGFQFSIGHFRIKFSMIAITSLTGHEKRKWICWFIFFVFVV